MLKRLRITSWPRMPPSSPSLAPFYARARRRRVWRRLHWPLLIGGLLLVIVVAALVVGRYLI
jgi:hypothetical protein